MGCGGSHIRGELSAGIDLEYWSSNNCAAAGCCAELCYISPSYNGRLGIIGRTQVTTHKDQVFSEDGLFRSCNLYETP